LGACERALLYINSQTWTNGAASNTLALYVEAAMEVGVELLLAHETRGEGSQGTHHGVDFEDVERATPQHLLAQGVYCKIATALKAGSLREVSMQLLAQELLTTVTEDATPPPLASTAAWSWLRRVVGLKAHTQPAPMPSCGTLVDSSRTPHPLLRTARGDTGSFQTFDTELVRA